MIQYEKTKQLLKVGKTKSIWKLDTKNVLIKFMDNVDAKGHEFTDKRMSNAKLRLDFCEKIFSFLDSNGVMNHWIKRIDNSHIEARYVEMFPLEVVVRNIAEGSVVKNYLFNSGEYLKKPMVNFYLKYGYLDPILDKDLFDELEIGTETDFKAIKNQVLKINELLKEYFLKYNLELIDFKAEFGRYFDNSIILADEISPDCIRLRDKTTKERIDKDLFRKEGFDLIEVLNKMNERVK